MLEQIIVAGFGGQGVLSLGKILAEAGMEEGKNVTWLPSYGPEMRGGTSNCNVIISDEWIGAPNITQADAVIAMNLPSLDKFESYVAPGAHLFVNSSIIERKANREDIHVHYVPANDIAENLGTVKAANMVMLGAYLAVRSVVDVETVIEKLKLAFGENKAHLVPLNRKAIEAGAQAVK
ncbi:MAG: 2-oxoacid:acceptor oxidoreductase family protein [Christensenellales bacterium]|jgi:2-oxoglutarate ferredoxin oxidoreductase subunit gamma